MNCKIENFCRLCLNLADHNFDAIDTITKNILDTLSLKIDFSLSKEPPLMCKNCADILQKCFDLVRLCQNTKDTIHPLHLSQKPNTKDLNDPEYKACLFCMGVVRRNVCTDVRQLEEDIVALQGSLSECIFELYAIASEEPVLCESCHKSLQIYMNFSKNCLDVEQEMKHRRELEEIVTKNQTKVYNLTQDIFSQKGPDCDSVKNAFKREDILCKTEQDPSITTEVKMESFLERNESLHTDVKLDENESESERHNEGQTTQKKLYKCDSCPFVTTTQRYLNKHSIRHDSVIPLFKCEICSFTTRHRWYLSTHALTHKDDSEVEVYKCSKCSYQTKFPSYMRRHHVNHDETLEYKCDKCPFVTKHSRSIKKHAITHKSPSEVTMYKCDSCPYETRFKKNLISHLLVHKDTSEVKMYSCEVCSYSSKVSHNLRVHKLVHKKETEVEILKCALCGYTTKRRTNLLQHLVVHKKLSEVQMFKCGLCGYEAKRKTNLVQHMMGVHGSGRDH